MAAGVIQRAIAQGTRVFVCIATNGDYQCADKTKGIRRLTESLEALALMGLSERYVSFLGYPDTGFAPEESFLGVLYAQKDPAKIHSSPCGQETYGIPCRKPDFRFARDGGHSSYTKAAFTTDLNDLLRLTKPELVITSSHWDTHGDHAALFRFAREAVLSLPVGVRPTLWESLIHSPAGDDYWPIADTNEFTLPQGFDEARWAERIRIPLRGTEERRLKCRAICTYRSALHFEHEPKVARYLLSFAKSEEIFWNAEL